MRYDSVLLVEPIRLCSCLKPRPNTLVEVVKRAIAAAVPAAWVRAFTVGLQNEMEGLRHLPSETLFAEVRVRRGHGIGPPHEKPCCTTAAGGPTEPSDGVGAMHPLRRDTTGSGHAQS